METQFETYEDRGLIAIYLLGEDGNGNPADQEDAEGWADQYGFGFPVVADPGWVISARFERDNYIPSSSLLSDGLEVAAVDANIYPGLIESALPEDWGGDDDDDE